MQITIHITFKDNGSTMIEEKVKEVELPVKNETVKWKFEQDEKIVKEGSSETDDNGILKIPDIELPEKETKEVEIVVDATLKFHYEIKGKKGEIIFVTRDLMTKTVDEKVIKNLFEKIQYISVNVRVAHTGEKSLIEPIKNTELSWFLHEQAVEEKPLETEDTAIDSETSKIPPQRKVVEPKPGNLVDKGKAKIDGIGVLMVYGVKIVQKEILFLKYEINGQENIIRLNRTGTNDIPTTIRRTEPLSGATVVIEFKGDVEKSEKPVKWILKTSADKELKKSDATEKTDSEGKLTIKNVTLGDKDVLKLQYEILGKERTVDIKHNSESRAGKPLVIVQYLGGVTVRVEFKSNLEISNKPVVWSLKNSADKELPKEEKSPDKTDENGALEIKNVELIDDEQTLKFQYKILDVERTVEVKQTAESKTGKPLVIIQYLAGIPIKITFLEEKVTVLKEKTSDSKEETANNPISGQNVKWKLTNEKSETVKEGETKTGEKGEMTIEQVDIVGQESLTFSYEIVGKKGSTNFDKRVLDINKDNGFRKGLDSTQYIAVIDESASIINPERLWLTYETRFNWGTYSKTNQQFDLRLYRAKFNNLLLICAPKTDLDNETLAALRDVFFPDVKDVNKLREFGKPPWEDMRSVSKSSKKKVAANRDVNIIHTSYAYLPYNSRDNTNASQAIGTHAVSRVHKLELTPFSTKLEMWNTASRSSVVRLKLAKRVNEKDAEPVLSENLMWKEYGSPKKDRFLKPDAKSGKELNLTKEGADFYKKLFSVKTGVNIIGFEIQEGKAKLEHNSILAALRSAYVRDIERLHHLDSFNDKKLLILTEILTVTELDPKWDKWIDWKTGRLKIKDSPQPDFGDGYQIRSLVGMKYDHEYFPPTSIPFVRIKDGKVDKDTACKLSFKNPDIPQSETVFEQIEEPEWRQFWKKHYAEALGRTKARLLLCYGLQGFGGNAQNFLLEMKDGLPNGRVVVRDMGDYALHDFILWSLFGPGHGEAPDPRNMKPGEQETVVQKWKDAFKKMPLLDFECSILNQYIHEIKTTTASGTPSEFPTFTGYHRWSESGMQTFNPFCACCYKTGANFVGHISPLWAYAMPVSPQKVRDYYAHLSAKRWAKVFEVETEWGISHAKSWIKYLEAALGHNFEINWEPLPIEKMLEKKDWIKSNKTEDYADRIYNPAAYSEYVAELLETDFYLVKENEEQAKKIAGKWTDLYDKMKIWEMYLGWQVENFLQTEKGQKAIRDFRKRGWQFCPPVLMFRASDKSNKPVENFTVTMKEIKTGEVWAELTDSNGEIRIYYGTSEDYEFTAKGWEGGYFSVKSINKSSGSNRFTFGEVKVEVLIG